MRSVLELENALGGDPGPGLGADSDFDKRQLQKVIKLSNCDLVELGVKLMGWIHKWQVGEFSTAMWFEVVSGL